MRLPPCMPAGSMPPKPVGIAIPIPPAVSTFTQYTAMGGLTGWFCAKAAGAIAASAALTATGSRFECFMMSPSFAVRFHAKLRIADLLEAFVLGHDLHEHFERFQHRRHAEVDRGLKA